MAGANPAPGPDSSGSLPPRLDTLDAWLCPSCGRSNRAALEYCAGCGSPPHRGQFRRAPLPAAGPARATKTADAKNRRRARRIVLLGAWLLFFPAWLGLGWLLLRTLQTWRWSWSGAVSLAGLLFFWIAAAMILWRVTWSQIPPRPAAGRQ